MDTQAVLHFRQDRTEFGCEAAFGIEIAGIGSFAIPGGELSRIKLPKAGTLRVKAEIDGYESSWVSIDLEVGDVVDLIVLPPEGKWARAVGLMGNRQAYLRLIELDRTNVLR